MLSSLLTLRPVGLGIPKPPVVAASVFVVAGRHALAFEPFEVMNLARNIPAVTYPLAPSTPCSSPKPQTFGC